MYWDKQKTLKMANSRIIKYSGRSLCENYLSPLKKCQTATQAIRLYKNCISWALLECYPTKEELLAFAPKDTLADNGVYIDTEFNGERIDNHICCVFLGCKGRIKTGLNAEKAIIPMLYLSDESEMEVKVDDGLTHPIPIELYYNSRVMGDTNKLSIKDYTGLTAEDNIGFTEEELSVDPDINNEDL